MIYTQKIYKQFNSFDFISFLAPNKDRLYFKKSCQDRMESIFELVYQSLLQG